MRYSIVVPVFNEAENIGPFCRRARRELPADFELLICYDMPEDTTLPALAALPAEDKPPVVRLIHNQLGPGVRFAIEAGMRAAQSPVVVVMMVDLADDFGQLEAMVAGVDAGACVVCGSRYMRGGRQLGGPWLKGLLSRAAGVSLHYLCAVPVHDITNSFKAYRRTFLEQVRIESTAGFCLGMELTLKAFFAGEKIEEVPVTWTDRTAGTSRFRLRKWLPTYLRWYLWALRKAWG